MVAACAGCRAEAVVVRHLGALALPLCEACDRMTDKCWAHHGLDDEAVRVRWAEYVEESYTPCPNTGCALPLLSESGSGETNAHAPGAVVGSAFYTVPLHLMALRASGRHLPAGMVARHLCGNRWCANPKHLVVGTHQENGDDERRAGKKRGVNNPRARLSEADVRRMLADPGRGNIAWAKELGVAPSTVWAVLSGRTWSHIPRPEPLHQQLLLLPVGAP